MSAEFKPNAVTELEPTSALTPMPLWLVMAMLLLLLGGAIMFDRSGGWFEAKVYQPYNSVADIKLWQPVTFGPDLDRGRSIYEKNCGICHGNDGLGKPGQNPPLAASDWVNAAGVNRLIRIPLLGLSGPIEVSGQVWNTGAAMPPFATTLQDRDIADILSYIRQAWGNKGAPVSEAEVQAIRKEIGGRSQALTAEELKKLPEKQ